MTSPTSDAPSSAPKSGDADASAADPGMAQIAHPALGKATAFGGIVVDHAGRVLLRRPSGDYDGYVWTFPKGRPDPGEDAAACARRETAEETGYATRILAPMPGAFPGGTSVTAYFLMQPDGPPGPHDAETSATRWATPDEAPQLIGQTKNKTGRMRDLAVLQAALDVLAALRARDAAGRMA